MEHLKQSINNQLLEDDWRLQGQESYLNGKTLYWRNYSEKSQLNDHDHCDFCTDEISDLPDTWHAGYSLLDEPHATICQKCYEDLCALPIWKAMSRDHFIHVIKPKIIQRMKVNDLFNHYLECGMQPLITMKWNGDLLIEFGVGEKAIVLDTGLNIKKFGDVIDEEN